MFGGALKITGEETAVELTPDAVAGCTSTALPQPFAVAVIGYLSIFRTLSHTRWQKESRVSLTTYAILAL
jgi:hypothetical protein